MLTRLLHAAHGEHIAYSGEEVKDCLSNGWHFKTLADAKQCGFGADKVFAAPEAPVRPRRGRPPKK